MLVVGKGEVKFGCNLVTCHSEERSDEESAFVRRTKKQIPLPHAGSDRQARGDIHVHWWAEGPCDTRDGVVGTFFISLPVI